MKIIDKIKSNFMNNNLFVALLSFAIAIFVWFFVSMTQYPSVQKTIEHIPLSLDISGTSAGLNGLSVTSCDVEEVTVELLGSRTQIGNFNNENLEAYIDSENISTTGTKKLSIKIRGNSNIKYEIKSVYPPSATVFLDKMDTREFSITPNIPNVSVSEGKVINLAELACEPSVIRITGPSAQLDKISKCYAVSNKKLSLDSAYVLASDEIQLYTEDNTVIDQSSFKFSDMNFNITIPVRTQKTVGFSVAVNNVPDNFDENILKFKLSADSVVLACNNSQTEIPDIIDIGVVPLNELKLGFSRTFSMNKQLENSEYINISELETVTVTLDDNGLAQTDLTLDQSHITIRNVPDSSYDYRILTQKMDISVVGPEDIISQITQEDIVADVNLINTTISSDQFNANVAFSCPTYNNVWVVTNSKVSIQRTKIEPVTNPTQAPVTTDVFTSSAN